MSDIIFNHKSSLANSASCLRVEQTGQPSACPSPVFASEQDEGVLEARREGRRESGRQIPPIIGEDRPDWRPSVAAAAAAAPIECCRPIDIINLFSRRRASVSNICLARRASESDGQRLVTDRPAGTA
jgi:hypothetical protein